MNNVEKKNHESDLYIFFINYTDISLFHWFLPIILLHSFSFCRCKNDFIEDQHRILCTHDWLRSWHSHQLDETNTSSRTILNAMHYPLARKRQNNSDWKHKPIRSHWWNDISKEVSRLSVSSKYNFNHNLFVTHLINKDDTYEKNIKHY